jgi:xanthine/uracil/vitamin C permease (AzgA family)
MTGIRMQANQELIAQGIGNMLIPFFGGVPATAAIARSSVGIKSGGQTRLVSIVHAVGLLLSMFLLTPFMERIPFGGAGWRVDGDRRPHERMGRDQIHLWQSVSRQT